MAKGRGRQSHKSDLDWGKSIKIWLLNFQSANLSKEDHCDLIPPKQETLTSLIRQRKACWTPADEHQIEIFKFVLNSYF